MSVQPSTPLAVRTFTNRRRRLTIASRSPWLTVAASAERRSMSWRSFKVAGPTYASPISRSRSGPDEHPASTHRHSRSTCGRSIPNRETDTRFTC